MSNKKKPDYDMFAKDFSQTRHYDWPEFDLISPLVSKKSRILDLGCGNGRLLQFLQTKTEFEGSYYGIDISNNMLLEAKKKFPKGTFLLMDFSRTLDFEKDFFDIVIGIASFHHLIYKKDQNKCFAEISRVLKPKGKIFLTTWNIPFWRYFRFNWNRLSFWKHRFCVFLIPFGKQRFPRFYKKVSAKTLAVFAKKFEFKVLKKQLFRQKNWILIAQKK